MFRYLVTLTILLLAFCGNAQNFPMAPQSQMINMQQQMNMQQMMMNRLLSQSQTKIQVAEKKLEKEERIQEKIQQKLEEKKTKLLMQEQELNALINKPDRSKDASTLKSIRTLEQEITKSTEKLAALNTEQEATAKNIEEYKKSVKAAEIEKEDIQKKQEEKKKLKKEEKESKTQRK